MESSKRIQRTIKLAIETRSGELVSAERLLTLNEADFTRERRLSIASRRARRSGGDDKPWICACCKHPVYLSRFVKMEGNRWFVHDAGSPADCPFHERSRLNAETIRAVVYRGQQEGAQHKALKAHLVRLLQADPEVSDVDTEKTTFSAVVRGEWRRPDVKCWYRGFQVVFEVQLSYTFLSEVLARDAFYKREGIFIIWVFRAFERHRSVVIDEAFFNHRNLFVLDESALTEGYACDRLLFTGHHQVPFLAGNQIRDEWQHAFVSLDDVVFCPQTFRPFFHDYESARQALVLQRDQMQHERAELTWRNLVDYYLYAARGYLDSHYRAERRGEVEAAVAQMRLDKHWSSALNALLLPSFLDHHGALAVLMSIREHRVIGYRVASVFQVMEAGLRTSNGTLAHAYAVLFLKAYKQWRPPVLERQARWLRVKAHAMKASLDAGETTYERFLGFDRAVATLYPEMAATLGLQV